MKKVLKDLFVLLVVIFVCVNTALNFYIRDGIRGFSDNINFLFCVSFIPDRVTFFGVRSGEARAFSVTVDTQMMNIIKKDFSKGLDGVAVTGLDIRFDAAAFVMPYFRYLKIRYSEISFWKGDKKLFFVNKINGKSTYEKSADVEGRRVVFDAKGKINGKSNEEIFIKLIHSPYKRNDFLFNVYGSRINIKEFEAFFRKNNIVIERGRMNFAAQFAVSGGRVNVNNIMRFEGVKIKEDIPMDIKYLFGISVEQMVDFLSDSKGNFAVDFSFEVKEQDLHRVLKIYGDKFAESVGNRILLGAVTAPVRAITDLLWGITGGLIFR
ncbi:MAG: hypothetical protein ACOC4H_01775 [bacterium]